MVCTCNVIFGLNEKGNPTLCYKINKPDIMLGEISQSQKEKYCIIPLMRYPK